MLSKSSKSSDRYPGPRYDAATRFLIETDFPAACRMLDVPLIGRGELLSAVWTLTTREADLVASIAPGELMHAEYVRDVTPDLVDRMLVYRGLIQGRKLGGNLTQRVIVLRNGTISGHNQAARGFTLGLHPFYLRERNPSSYLAIPSMAAFAVLGRGNVRQRTLAFAESLRIIEAAGGKFRKGRLECARSLANLRLNRATIDRLTKEAGMSIQEIMMSEWEAMYEEAREECDKGLREGRDKGLRQGREEGRDEARIELLTAFLRDAFGDRPDLPGVARELARWPDPSAAIHAITNATTLADVLGPEASSFR